MRWGRPAGRPVRGGSPSPGKGDPWPDPDSESLTRASEAAFDLGGDRFRVTTLTLRFRTLAFAEGRSRDHLTEDRSVVDLRGVL